MLEFCQCSGYIVCIDKCTFPGNESYHTLVSSQFSLILYPLGAKTSVILVSASTCAAHHKFGLFYNALLKSYIASTIASVGVMLGCVTYLFEDCVMDLCLPGGFYKICIY